MSLTEYIRVLVKWRKVLYFNVIVITLFSVVLAFVLPKRYVASTSFIPTTSYSMPTTYPYPEISTYIGLSPYISGFGQVVSPSDIFSGFLNHRAVQERVIKRTNLMKRKKFKENKSALEWLRNVAQVSQSPEGIVTISVATQESELSAVVANAYYQSLLEVTQNLYLEYTKWKTKFLKDAVKEAKKRVKMASDSLKAFQKRHKIFDIEREYPHSFNIYTQLKRDELEKEIELKTLSAYTPKNNPALKKIQDELINIRREIRKLETAKKGSGFGSAFGSSLSEMPDISAEYKRRKLEVDAQSSAYSFLLTEYEKAQVEENTKAPLVNLLEKADPELAEKQPKKTVVVLLGFFLSFFFGIFLCFYFEFIEKVEKDPKFEHLRNILAPIRRDIPFLKK